MSHRTLKSLLLAALLGVVAAGNGDERPQGGADGRGRAGDHHQVSPDGCERAIVGRRDGVRQLQLREVLPVQAFGADLRRLFLPAAPETNIASAARQNPGQRRPPAPGPENRHRVRHGVG